MRISLSTIVFCLLFLAGIVPAAAQAPGTPVDTARGPQTFAMIMGISTYKYIRPLTYADKDAELFRDYLKSPGGGKLKDDNIYILLNEEAKAANFWVKGMAWLKSKQLRKGDKLFIYLAGHGDAIDQDEFFFLTYDCNPAGDKNNYIVTGNIQLYNLKSRIADFSAKGVDVMFIMDACRSNELPGGKEGQQALNAAISEKKAGEIIMLATGAGQESLEDASIGTGHGLFTYYLVDGLTGMADTTDGTVDYKITLKELKSYVDKNVSAIAQQRFRRRQDPFICCDENNDHTIAIVDTAYLAKWLSTKKLVGKGPGNSFSPRGRGNAWAPVDTQLVETYNLFNKAVKESKLTGAASAEYYYELMAKKFPGNSYTIDAKATLAVEFINFAQSKINLYLECKDASTVQRIRAQIDEDERTDEINTSLDRMEKVAREEFYEVGNMLEKAIRYISEDDPVFAQSLTGRMYFFKARGYFGRARKKVDINDAFRYAYTAYSSDKNAAYILNTLASLHLDNNRIDSAIIYAKRAIFSAPMWRYPYVTLAFCYKTQNRTDSALKYYRKAVEVDPSNADAYVDLGHYYYSLSRKDSAVANYQRALRIEPNNVYASNNIGWVYHDKKVYDSAVVYFKRSIQADPKFINAYNGLAKTFFETSQFDSARIYYSRAFSNYQDKSIVNVYIGNFYKDMKQYDSAKVYYRNAFSLDPNYEEAYNDLGQAFYLNKELDSAQYYYGRALQVNPYSAFALINIGIVFKDKKKPDSTYSYFQQAVMLEPGNPAILNNLGVIYGQEKNYDSARNYFRRALQVRPDYKPASNNLIRIFREMNLPDSVTNFLKGSSLAEPGSVPYLYEMSQAFLDQKRFDSVRVYMRQALRQDPGNPQLLNNMGLAMQGLKIYDSAGYYLQRATRVDPENPGIWLNLANAFRQMKEPDSAIYYYKKQLSKKTDMNASAIQNIGNFFNDMKVYDSAVVYYKKAIALDPNYIPAYNRAGLTYMDMEMNDSAFVYLKKAVALDPNYQNASLNLGLLYHSQRQYDSAIVLIQRAIRLDPSKGKTYFQLACSYALSNQPEQAIRYLEQAYQRGYKNTDNLLNDPDLSGLKDMKGYQDLLDKYAPGWRDKH